MTQEPARLPAVPTRTPTLPVPTRAPGAVEEPEAVPEGLFHLVLLDDDHHTYAYVIEMLGTIFGYGREKAFTLAALVDSHGEVIVETAGYQQVSRHQQRIHAYGADPRLEQSRGSMSAVIKQAGPPEGDAGA